jgi:hypothetical protein
MAKQDVLRAKLQAKIFTPYGKSVTLKKPLTPSHNVRGELEQSTYTTSTIVVVPYNLIDSRRAFQKFGELKDGEMEMAVPYNVSVAVDDLITMEGADWKIVQAEKNYLPDNVVNIIRLTKVLA